MRSLSFYAYFSTSIYSSTFSCFIIGFLFLNSLFLTFAPEASAESYVFRFYREYISPADGDRCPMSPTCSGYSAEAVRKHGFFMGWIMSCDRLIRCGRDEVNLSKTVVSGDGREHTSDPVENNDFWWYDNDSGR